MEWFTSLEEATSPLALDDETRRRLRPALSLIAGITDKWPEDKEFKLDPHWSDF